MIPSGGNQGSLRGFPPGFFGVYLHLAVALSALGHWGASGVPQPWPGLLCTPKPGHLDSRTGNMDFDR